MCARYENFVVHLRTSRALSERFLSRWHDSVNSISSHTMSTLLEVFLCSEQFYMHKNTSRSVLIVWELIELTESCRLVKKRSESALEVRRCTTKFSYLAHMRRRRSPVQMQVYIPGEQFYMHKNTSRSVLIVWELIELTESCHLLKKRSESALEVRRCTTKFSYLAHMRRKRSPVQMQVYIPYRTVHWDVNLHLNRWSPSAHVCKVREFRGTSAHFQSTFRALFNQATWLC